MLVSQTIPVGVKLFSYVNTFFCSGHVSEKALLESLLPGYISGNLSSDVAATFLSDERQPEVRVFLF